MNLAMPPPISYSYYMDASQYPLTNPWPSNPYQYSVPMHPPFPNAYQTTPSYPSPFILRHAPRPPVPNRFSSTGSSYSNTRYNHLKQSSSYVHRHRSMDPSFYQPMPIPPPSLSHSHYPSHSGPMKTKSVSDFHQLAQVTSTHLSKAHSWHSIHPSNSNIPPQCRLSCASPPLPASLKPALPRMSTFHEMPIIQNPIYKRSQSSSSQGSPCNHHEKMVSPSHSCSSSSSSSSSITSHQSFQQRCNGSLRTDPLLVAAMQDFQQHRRTSNMSTPLITPLGNLSRDSLCSDSTDHTSTRSRSHSQSSFTSMERLEIRHLIKALKEKGLSSLDLPASSETAMLSRAVKAAVPKTNVSAPTAKHQKSSITEELDQKFAQLRSTQPNEELIYVKPSLLKKQDQPSSCPSATNTKASIVRELIEIPIAPPLPPSRPPEAAPSYEKGPISKPEYAVPMKQTVEVNIRSHSKKTDQCRSFSFCKPMNDLVHETRPVSMFNWFQYGLTNPIPPSLQTKGNAKHIGKSLVKENIYASEIDVHVPHADEKGYFHDPNLMFDYLSTCKSSTKHSSVFHEFSRLFTRFGHHQHRQEKCKRKSKLQKNNHLSCTLM